jgi:hypothetical protein
MRRITVLAILVLATLVAAGCGKFGDTKGDSGSDKGKDAAGNEKRITSEKFDDAVKTKYGCTDVKEYESEGSTHVDKSERVTYKHNPPHSGNHWNDPSVNAPAEYGLYDEELKDEQTVHNLEHGHIVITWKGLSDKEKDDLYEMAAVNPFHILVYPRKKNPKKGVYLTAWTAQMYCEKPSKAALQYMIDKWRDQAPELYTNDPSMETGDKN